MSRLLRLFGATSIVLFAAGPASAQRGGGHGGGGGGAHAGGGNHAGSYHGGGYAGGYRGGYYGGYRGGYYGGYGYGYGFGVPYYGLGYGFGFPSYGGVGPYPAAGSPYGGGYSSSGYPPAVGGVGGSIPLDPAPAAPPDLGPGPNGGSGPGSGLPVSAQVPAVAKLSVIVPDGGQVWFDNTLSQKSGTHWVYTSAALEPGKMYTVSVKARWGDGQAGSFDLPLRIQAGDDLTVDLTRIR